MLESLDRQRSCLTRPMFGVVLAASLVLGGGCRALYNPTVTLKPLPRTRGLSATSIPEVLGLEEDEIDEAVDRLKRALDAVWQEVK